MIHWQWRTIEVASGVMNAWPPKEERKREVLTFRGAKVTSITPLSDPKAYAKLMKNAADAAAKRPSNVAPITQPAFVRLELPPGSEKEKSKTREVYIVVPDDELQAWLRVFTGAQDAQRYSLLPEEPAKAPAVLTTPSPAQSHLKTAPGAMMHAAKTPAPTDAASPARAAPSSAQSSAPSSGGAGRGTAGSAQRPVSMGLATAPPPVTRPAPGSAAPSARPLSLALASGPLPAAALPPDPNKMLATVMEPEPWAFGTQHPGTLDLEDPEDGPVIIASAPPAAVAPLPLGAVSSSEDGAGATCGPWTEYFDDDGVPYYHNEITNETTWERPPEFDQLAPLPLAPAPAALPPMPVLAPPPHAYAPQLPSQQLPPAQYPARGGFGGVARGGAVYAVPRGGATAAHGGHAPLPAYPQSQSPADGPSSAGEATQAALSSHDAVDVLAALDEFADMHFGVGTLPAAVTDGADAGARGGVGAVASPFGSQTLAELDELNNPEFF